jgi:predicted DNA binding CopG/RHH family protein
MAARIGRPPLDDDQKKIAISIRISPDLLARLKSRADRDGVGYQTLIHSILSADSPA